MKRVLKGCADFFATLIMLPFVAVFKANCFAFGAERAFPGWSQAFSLVPGLSGVYLRRAFYRQVFRQFGSGASVSFGTVFSHSDCSIGQDAYIGLFCCLGEVTVGDDVLIGSHVSITNGSAQHGIARLDIPVREQSGVWPHVTIGADSWIGDRAVIMADVGTHCVIGAGAVVTKSIPEFAIAVGVPAKIIGYRKTAANSKWHIDSDIGEVR
jgi:acetyltransferase-like isoleucine patch superfamily enzyme